MNQESQTINLSDEFDLNDYRGDQIEIELSSSKHSFPFFQIYRYSERIQREYTNDYIKEKIKQDINDIQRKLNITDNTLSIFVRLLNDEKVSINNENYIELFKLSKFYEIHPLNKLLNQFAQVHSKDVNFIIQIIQSIEMIETSDEIFNEINIVDYENILKDEINECLINDNFGNLPISAIHRILKKSDMKKVDQKLLFDFIMKNIDERYILFTFLTIEAMNEETFNELYSKYEESNEKCQFALISPHLRYIKDLRESKKQLEEQIKKLKKSNGALEERTKELTNENEKLLNKVSHNEEQIREIRKKNEENEAQINKQEASNNLLQNQIATVTNENGLLQQKIKKQEDKFNELQMQLHQLKKENEKVKQEIKASQDNRLKIFKEIPFENELDGIFNYLRKNSNINDEVQLSHSSSYIDDPKDIFQFESIGNVYGFRCDPQAWLCFEFKKHKIILSNYTIRSYTHGVYNPRSWVIEGSNDYSKWTSLDEQNDCQYMKGRTGDRHHIHTFPIQKSKQEPFKYIKMTHKGENWGGNSYLNLNCIEFYGQLL